MSYNIRYDNPNDGIDTWQNRKDWVADQIRYYDPGIVGLQEVLHSQLVYLDSALTSHTYVGVGREDGAEAGEYSPLLIDTTRYEILSSGTFWLSDTPGKPSVGWDAALERICTWVRVRDLSGQPYFVLNTHFDHRGELARLRSAQLLTQKIREMNRSSYPVILTGDLNTLPSSAPIAHLNTILNDSKKISIKEPYGPEGTLNGFDVSNPLHDRIDYILVSDDMEVLEYAVISEVRAGRSPSDHLPVLVKTRRKN
ncbi:endonuclease/exonuclease/phosphatase family protein [Balneola sp. MJW-20]|uniref:endonuclease/exonuclease/phosphatase family protein n=1 Tax=Gracilimonas aurantiaca TaxID=3234185 RepID=UPI00390A5F86